MSFRFLGMDETQWLLSAALVFNVATLAYDWPEHPSSQAEPLRGVSGTTRAEASCPTQPIIQSTRSLANG